MRVSEFTTLYEMVMHGNVFQDTIQGTASSNMDFITVNIYTVDENWSGKVRNGSNIDSGKGLGIVSITFNYVSFNIAPTVALSSITL